MKGFLYKLNARFFSETLVGMLLFAFITAFMVFLFGRALKILRRKDEKLYLKILKCSLIAVFVGSWFIYSIFIFCNYECKVLSEKITLSDMRGENKKDVIIFLKKNGINVKTETEYSDDYSKDIIIRQSRWPNESLMKGDTIVLTISLGAEPLKLKDYVSHTFSDAENEVKEMGLSVNVKEQYSSVAKKGKIIKQLPKANEVVYKGDIITFYVSKGGEQVKVPNLYGMTEIKAKKKLKGEGFKIKIKHGYNNIERGKVFLQNIDAYSTVKKGTLITIYISLGLQSSNNTYGDNKNLNLNSTNKKVKSPKSSSTKRKDNKTVNNSKDVVTVDDSGADVVYH